jgi:hypothetical protein
MEPNPQFDETLYSERGSNALGSYIRRNASGQLSGWQGELKTDGKPGSSLASFEEFSGSNIILNLEVKVKRSLALFSFAIFLFFGWLTAPAGAQTAATVNAARPAPMYDASKEVTITGTVSNVVTKPAAGMIAGGHLIVATSKGPVDAHVGRRLAGTNAIAVKAGDSVTLVGVMATENHSEVFLVRTADTGGHTYTIRSEKGFLITPVAARGTSTAPARGSLR